MDVNARSRNRATIADVATAADVSRATVSRVLNNSPLVNEKTVQKVQAATRAVNFVMNAQGRALATGRADLIAILMTEPVDELLSDPTYARILRGITERLASTNYLPSIVLATNAQQRKHAARHFAQSRIDAVIDLCPYEGMEILDALRGSHLPVVLCGQLENKSYEGEFSTVYSDDIVGATLAGKFMHKLGRRNIAVIMGPKSNPASIDRLQGYEEGLACPIPPTHIRHTGWDSQSGFASMMSLTHSIPGIDGILAGSDRIAAGAIAALNSLGLRVPEDISVIGFDDNPIASSFSPALTTIHQPLLKEGKAAAQLAIDMLNGAEPTTLVMDMHLVERESA
ncbi:LacI family DNA-binding transcriptional regulator [uncultured Varibaculum sp.]|uniref:LacI family DNA-binding transcriptional regulator n=1 Tax=uncultured Varibaculum sp. TaxID=413896 RepID=UPI0028897D3D|nr:LacI family DNA-binding transcriptional regulator [uncultured Varibaculum sp.]